MEEIEFNLNDDSPSSPLNTMATEISEEDFNSNVVPSCNPLAEPLELEHDDNVEPVLPWRLRWVKLELGLLTQSLGSAAFDNNGETMVLQLLDSLDKLPVTVSDLEAIAEVSLLGILRRREGEVKRKATNLYKKWRKVLVESEMEEKKEEVEQQEEEDHHKLK